VGLHRHVTVYENPEVPNTSHWLHDITTDGPVGTYFYCLSTSITGDSKNNDSEQSNNICKK